MDQRRVGVLVGSLRKAAYSRMTAKTLAALAPPELKLGEIGIGSMPFYNEELETDAPPAPWTEFRREVAAVDAILFVTPEYNRGIPGALKNAIDVGSRPWGRSVWTGKPAAVISTSPGALGGMAASYHLRQVLVGVLMPVMAEPEAYIHGIGGLFDAEGRLTNATTRDFLTKFMANFATWIARLDRR